MGADGPTHAGSFDLAYLATLPNFVLMAPADEAELTHMVATAVGIDDRPSAIRYPRGEGTGVARPAEGVPLPIGKGRMIREGSSIAILSLGARLSEVLLAAEKLSGYGLSPTIADARFAKPLDTDLIAKLAREHEVLITIEEGAAGGFGSHVMQFLAWEGLLDKGLKVRPMTLPDVFQDQDTPERMYAQAGLDADGIVKVALSALGRRTKCRPLWARSPKRGMRADVFLVEQGYAKSRSEAQAAIKAGLGEGQRHAAVQAVPEHRRGRLHRIPQAASLCFPRRWQAGCGAGSFRLVTPGARAASILAPPPAASPRCCWNRARRGFMPWMWATAR